MPPNPERQAKRAAMREQFAADPTMQLEREEAERKIREGFYEKPEGGFGYEPGSEAAGRYAADNPVPPPAPPAPPAPPRPSAPPLNQPPIGPPTVPSTPVIRGSSPGIRGGGGMMTGPTHQIAPTMRVTPSGIPPLTPEEQQKLGVKFARGGSVKHGSGTVVTCKNKFG